MTFGPPDTVRLCAYLDDGITWQEAETLVREAWTETEAERYALDMRIVRWFTWKRPAYTYQGIMAAFVRIPMRRPCDRNLYFVNRHVGDVAWGLSALAIPLPEVLGAVDDETGTRIMVVARRVTITGALVLTPTRTLRHELEHALGCQHGVTMTACYTTIAKVKAMHRNPDDFFPSMSADGQIFTRWAERRE
jgi:hypothetical protein